MRWRLLTFATAGTLALAGCSAADAESPEKETYLSLGDSLAVGYQPSEDGGGETPGAYTDSLFKMLYDEDSTLEHTRLGCPGENTTTMLDGSQEHCHYDEGSQIDAAEAFLEDNQGEVRLVTVGIGANNFTGCVEELEDDGGDAEDSEDGGVTGFDIDEDCVDDGMDALRTEIPQIMTRLREAAGDDVQIIGMNYYNPFVVALLLDEEADEDAAEPEDGGEAGEDADSDAAGDMSGEELAEYGNEVLEELNEVLASAYAANDIDLADVAEEFDWDNFEVPADSETEMPANVQMICDYTWMCDTSIGPDIHANDAGGRLIAEVFEQEVQTD